MNMKTVKSISEFIMKCAPVLIGSFNWLMIVLIGYGIFMAEKYLPGGWVKDNFFQLVAAVVVTTILGYMERSRRANAKIYDNGVRLHDPDSGRDMHYEAIIRINRLSFWVYPWQRLVMPIVCDVVRIARSTGSTSVTPKRVKWLAGTDGVCWNIGSNEYLEGDAASHFQEYKDQLENIPNPSKAEKDKLEGMNRILKAGLKFK